MMLKLDLSELDLQDALDLAILIEREAQERYQMFVDQLGAVDGADFFATMVRNEKAHGDELKARRSKLFGDAPSRVNEDMIQDVEAPETRKSEPYISPRKALEVAMESEVKAHDFFDQALPHIKDAEVRKLFEELRDEELEHQRLLEGQKTRFSDSLEPDVDPDAVDTPAL